MDDPEPKPTAIEGRKSAAARMMDMIDGWFLLLKDEEAREGGLTDSGLSAEDVYNLYLEASDAVARIKIYDFEMSKAVTAAFVIDRILPALFGYDLPNEPNPP